MDSEEESLDLNPAPDDDATRFFSGEAGEDNEDSVELDFEEFDLDLSEPETSGSFGILGEYLLLEPIGAGGMGKVFRAEHRTMNREVALKVLSEEFAGKETLLKQFFAEIRAVAKLMHPNIVTAFDAGTAGSTHFLVMELVEGGVLSQTVRTHGPMTMAGAVSILEQAGKALAYAHDLGIVHRDIKPSNMMLTATGVLKLMDFGLARIANQDEETPGKKKRYFMGTPEYMSPEQVESPDEVDGRSDLYSLGASLCYLLTGKAMFRGEKMQVARAHIHETPKPLYELRPELDLRIDTVFQRLVAKSPQDRYASAHELLEHMQALELSAEPATGSSLGGRTNYRLAVDSATTSAGTGQSTLAKKSQVVGIDLGLLTSSAAVYVPKSGPQVVSQGEGHPLYLRNMLWSAGKKVTIGADASAKRQVDPDKIFHSIQRFIGQKEIQRPFGDKIAPPEVLLAAVIRQVMNNAAETAENSNNAVVTVPACYGQMHRRAIRNACQVAGVELVQLLDKPLAAALTWIDLNGRLSESRQAKRAADDRLLVVQLTGAGLDASVIHAHGRTVKQLGHCGHWKFGLQRWQHMLVQYLAEKLREQTGKDIRSDLAAATRLQRTVEIAINQLTSSSKVEVRFDWLGASIQQIVSQEGLSKIAPDLTLCIQQCVATACSIAKTDLHEIDRVLLSGAMMRMKSMQRIVTDVIPHDVEVIWMEKADLARGAAIYGRQLSSLPAEEEMLPSAVACAGNEVALLAESPDSTQKRPKILIERGKPVPTSYSRTLRPKVVNGRSAALPSLQLIESSSIGEGNWLKLGRIDPSEAFPNLASEDILQLRLEVDPSGILEASLAMPKTNQVAILPSSSEPELTPEAIATWRDWLEELLLTSGTH